MSSYEEERIGLRRRVTLATAGAVLAIATMPGVVLATAGTAALGLAAFSLGSELKGYFTTGSEEKKVYKKALGEYQAKAAENEASLREYAEKFKSYIHPEFLTSLDGDFLSEVNDIDELTNLFRIQSGLVSLNAAFDEASEQGIDLEGADGLYAFQQSFDAKISRGDYHFGEETDLIASLQEKVRIILIKLKNENQLEKVDSILAKVENTIDEPALLVFHNELVKLLEKSVKTAKKPDYEAELVLRKRKIAELVNEVESVSHPCKAMEEFKEILSATKEQLSNPDYGAKEKIEMSDIHYPWLLDSYRKIKADYQWFEDAKKRFDELQSIYLSGCAILDLQPEPFQLDFSDPKGSLAELEKRVEAIQKPAEDRAKVKLTLKGIDAVMRRKNCAHILSTVERGKNGETNREVYHLDNGNVVTFFVTPNHFRYAVTGVKISGVEKDIYSINQSQVKMCQINKEIEKILALYGVETTAVELVKPEMRYAKEIELEDVSLEKMEFLKAQKRHRSTSEQKARHIGG